MDEKVGGYMIKRFTSLISVVLILCMVTACSSGYTDTAEPTVIETQQESTMGYEQISADKAKEIMDTHSGYVIIDSRTLEEYDAGHIAGAIMIPEYEITDRAPEAIPDKDTLILVYCRSGRRSKIAAQALVDMGYTNVKEFGGIIDWPYEIVQ